MSLELSDGDQSCDIADGDETPDIDRAVDAVADGSTQKRAVRGDSDRSHAFIFFRHKLVAALVLSEVPDANVSPAITGDKLSLVRMNYDVVYWYAVIVVSLNVSAAGVPDFHRS
jgi:hypothetical protein